jgi:hypothetical protein
MMPPKKKQNKNQKKPHKYLGLLFFFFLSALEFEPRTSTTQGTLPALFVLLIFEIGSLKLFALLA